MEEEMGPIHFEVLNGCVGQREEEIWLNQTCEIGQEPRWVYTRALQNFFHYDFCVTRCLTHIEFTFFVANAGAFGCESDFCHHFYMLKNENCLLSRILIQDGV